MLKFDRQGLIPVVIQDDGSEEVLMVAFMNHDALQRTRETGYTHFFSRSRNTLWRKGEQSGNAQEVCAIFVNCEENSLLIRVRQQGGAACHDGYRSCYYRRLNEDDSYTTVAERVFDPTVVYASAPAHTTVTISAPSIPPVSPVPPVPSTVSAQSIDTHKKEREEQQQQLEIEMRQLYGVYLYLRDHDLSEQSNTSRLLQEHSHSYLVARLADELEELADVQIGEHVHSGREADTILEGSQVGYWLLLLASTHNVRFDDFAPHRAVLDGYYGHYSQEKAVEVRQECLNLLASQEQAMLAQGLSIGFTFIGWACAEASVSPLAPAEYDLNQMRRKGLVK